MRDVSAPELAGIFLARPEQPEPGIPLARLDGRALLRSHPILEQATGWRLYGPSGLSCCFSPDSAHVAYMAEVGGTWHPVADGWLGPPCRGGGYPTFDAEGRARFVTIRDRFVHRVTYDG